MGGGVAWEAEQKEKDWKTDKVYSDLLLDPINSWSGQYSKGMKKKSSHCIISV